MSGLPERLPPAWPGPSCINEGSIARIPVDRIAYYHIELTEHAVILAEGLPVESYLDLGDRANFIGGETIALFPSFSPRFAPETALAWETRGAAPLVVTGETLAAARRMILESASRGGDGIDAPTGPVKFPVR